MTIDLETPIVVVLPEGRFLATRVTVALSQTLRVYGTLDGIPRVIPSSVWHETFDELPADIIIKRLPTLNYYLCEPGKTS
jgi:hypothetical protein